MSKPLHESGGAIRDNFNSYALLILFVFNLLDQITKGQNIVERSYLTVPFLVISFLIYWDKTSKQTKSILFLGLGVAYQFSLPNQTYLGSTIFFSLAFLQYADYKYGVMCVFISIILIVYKATISSATPSQTIVSLIAFMFIYGNIYKLVREYKDNIKRLNYYYINQIAKLKEDLNKAINGEIEPRRNIDAINITQEEKAILHLYCEGYDYNRIQKTLGLNIAPNSVRRKITAIKKENKNKILNGKSKETNINDAQFGKWLYQKV